MDTMESICRLCCTCSDIEAMENLFDDRNKRLLSKLTYLAYFTFRIGVNDGFPPYICIRCTKLLRSAYEFKMICESAEANFWALSQSQPIADTIQMKDKCHIEWVDCERDGTLKHLEVVCIDSSATEAATANDDSGSQIICSDRSGEENPSKSDLIIHTNAHGMIQSTTPLQVNSEKRKICTKVTGSTCDICGETFRRKRDLERHMKMAHHSRQKIVREKSWICESCGKNFRSLNALNYHIKGTHVDTVEKNYSCDLCDFKCRQARYLVSHALKHTGARPHRCVECGLAFGFQGSLNRHVQAVHRQARPHKCTICDRYFKTRVRLKDHWNTHTGQDHQCPLCSKTYRYKNSLARHLKKYHRRGATNSASDSGQNIREIYVIDE